MSPLIELQSRDDATHTVANLLEAAILTSIGTRGEANLWLSGGSTPGPVYEVLSTRNLPWDQVRVGLVDERWVPETDVRSNAHLIKETLLKSHAAQIGNFLPMYVEGVSPAEDASFMDSAYQEVFEVPPIVLLGMGTDGHTASWFPELENLEEVISADNSNWIVSVDASNSPVAGDTPQRITLTGAALSYASFAVLYITGEEKRRVLENTSANLPIHHAVKLLGSLMKIVWAP